jgi:hypothetical protein
MHCSTAGPSLSSNSDGGRRNSIESEKADGLARDEVWVGHRFAVLADAQEAEAEIRSQRDLFEAETPEELEKIPFDFSYEFEMRFPWMPGTPDEVYRLGNGPIVAEMETGLRE